MIDVNVVNFITVGVIATTALILFGMLDRKNRGKND